MAQLLDLSSLTLNPIQAENSNQAVFERLYTKPELEAAHYLLTGVMANTYIPIFGQFGLGGRVDPGSCGVNASADYIAPSQKQWSPVLISERLPHCQTDIDQDFRLWKRAASALKTWEDVDNEQLAFIEDRIVDAMKEWILRLTSFGDTSALNVSGGGYIKNGVSVTYFTPLNGLWQQIYTAVAASTITKIDITENALASYTAQLALAPDRAISVMRDMYNKADSRIFAAGSQPVFQITKSLANNFEDYLEDKSLGFSLQVAEDGKQKWAYRGIPIIIRHDWDRNIRAYEDNGTTYRLPHRAILTDIKNIPVATSESGDFTNYDMWYSKENKKLYTDIAFYLDVKLLQESMIQVAY
jgi:hypothetical protein